MQYVPNSLPTAQHYHQYQHDSNGSGGSQYEPFQPSTPLKMSVAPPLQTQTMDLDGNGEGDLPMEDADIDPFDAEKYNIPREYPVRPYHRSRPSSQYLTQEDSSAARRYSPMNLSPTSPLNASQNHYNSYTPHAQTSHQSPTRSQNHYSSPTSRPQTSQLPTLQPIWSPDGTYHPPRSATQQLHAVFGRDPSSPLQPQMSPMPQGQVPKFTRCTNVADLRPKINAQPAFRRANPEGGFISPLQALTTQLPSTFRICNPNFKYETSRNPRRVLTKPSKGCKNDGYDNEDSDYILYVNDILGSEETGHKNRYLILDVLGQGTFGQVVKCQNLKTQEVIAVKVVKNRTAYFNQSMMEVSVLDLVGSFSLVPEDLELITL